jgi:prolyl oligopeptidase
VRFDLSRFPVADEPHVVLKEDVQAVVTGLACLNDSTVVLRVRGAASELLETGDTGVHAIPLPGPGGVSGLTSSRDRCWFDYSDLVTPPTVLEFGGGSTLASPWFTPANGSRRAALDFWEADCLSTGGVKLHVSGFTSARSADRRPPAFLRAYGGFGKVPIARYSPEAAAWVAGGGAFALAYVRGGGEHGKDWHSAGRGAAKVHAVEDLEAAAANLRRIGRVRADGIAVGGTSNGGLLAAAAALRRPELFAACVAVNPVADVLAYDQGGAGQGWVSEYGDLSLPEVRAAADAYSPYELAKRAVQAPAFLIIGTSADQTVPSWHGRKLAAALQRATARGAESVLVLYSEKDVGNHAWLPQESIVADVADILLFLSQSLNHRLEADQA